MCNCIKNSEEKVTKHLIEKNIDAAVIGEVSMKHTGFNFGKRTFQQTYNEVEYELTPKKKDGTMGRQVNKTISLYHTYCPFCGKKYPNSK